MPDTYISVGAGAASGLSAAAVPALIKAVDRSMTFQITGVNVNSAAADVGTFSGLPTKWRLMRITVFEASANLTLATIDVRTATGGGGTALVSAFSMATLTATTKYVDATLAAAGTTDYQTTTILTVRNVTAQGGAATVSILLEIQDLS